MHKSTAATPEGIDRAEKELRKLSPQEILALATGVGAAFKKRVASGRGTKEDFALHNEINRQLAGRK